jgi:pimeloyl-ACP methyl ester carboxylesterase
MRQRAWTSWPAWAQDNLDELGLALAGEQALRPYIEEQLPGMAAATPEELVEHMSSLLPEVDRACLTGDVGADFAAAMNRVGRAGPDGWIDDDLAFMRPWGFDLDQVRAPVSLWQGELDLMVPFAHGQWLAPRIPGVHAHLEPGQGHLSVTVGAVDRMLDELAALVAS